MVLSFTALLIVGTDYPPGKFTQLSEKQVLPRGENKRLVRI